MNAASHTAQRLGQCVEVRSILVPIDFTTASLVGLNAGLIILTIRDLRSLKHLISKHVAQWGYPGHAMPSAARAVPHSGQTRFGA